MRSYFNLAAELYQVKYILFKLEHFEKKCPSSYPKLLYRFVFDSVYVNLQYDEISLTFTAVSVVIWSFCEVVVVCGGFCDWCVYCCLSFMCVCCECDANSGVGDVVVVSVWHVSGTRSSGTVSSAADVIGMSVVCGMRGDVYVFDSGQHGKRGVWDLPIL